MFEKTTAQLRVLAYEAAERLEWQKAADLYNLAADRYGDINPGQALKLRDRQALRDRAASCERMAGAE